MSDLVCPLYIALYGHPDSGGCWEKHCGDHLRSVGFVECDPWRSCFWHPQLKLFLVVYVDDFKLAGPTASMKPGGELIRQGLETEEPHALNLYLGCQHIQSTRVLPDTGVTVRVMEYNMESFLRSSVDRYREITGVQYMRHAAPPFLHETGSPDFSLEAAGLEAPTESDIESAHSALLWASHQGGDGPSLGVTINAAVPKRKGDRIVSHVPDAVTAVIPKQLKPYAAKILMKVLYCARYARPDLLRAICYLAQFITKWDDA